MALLLENTYLIVANPEYTQFDFQKKSPCKAFKTDDEGINLEIRFDADGVEKEITLCFEEDEAKELAKWILAKLDD